MSSVIDYSLLTLNSAEAQSASEAVFKKTLQSPELTSIHAIQTGVEMDKYIPIFGRLGLVGRAAQGGCVSNVVQSSIPVTQKQWTPKLIQDRIEHCQEDIPQLLKMWKRSRIAKNLWSNIDNEALAFIEDRLYDAIQESIVRITEFNATTHSPNGDQNGDQLLTAGTNKAFFNILDGMWPQIFALTANNKIYRYTITENAASTKTNQLNLANDTALKVFRALYANIPAQAFGRGSNLVIQCTRSLLNNWIDYLEGQSLGFTLTRAEQGSNQWQYRGIPIIPRPDWDNIIRTYFDNGITWYLPHRAILADINAIPIGTSDTDSLYSLTSEYNSYHKKHVIDFAYRIDCKVVDEELVAVAV